MGSFSESMDEYKKQLEKGAIQQAYKGLMEYILNLRTHFKSKYHDYFVSGNLYSGTMDMTYFSFIPPSLKERNLKIAVVFNHCAFRFEVWLAGYNKQIQGEYWKLFKDSAWTGYPVVPTTKGVDAIIEHTLVARPDFSDLDALTVQIERETLVFIREIESFLSKEDNPR
jgi:hypothetical protein